MSLRAVNHFKIQQVLNLAVRRQDKPKSLGWVGNGEKLMQFAIEFQESSCFRALGFSEYE